MLPGADDDELQEVVFVSLGGVVVEDLGAIGVQPFRRERMLETDVLRERINGRPDAL